jgi:hypothetical protein
MMRATSSLFLPPPVMTCFPVPSRFLVRSQLPAARPTRVRAGTNGRRIPSIASSSSASAARPATPSSSSSRTAHSSQMPASAWVRATRRTARRRGRWVRISMAPCMATSSSRSRARRRPPTARASSGCQRFPAQQRDSSRVTSRVRRSPLAPSSSITPGTTATTSSSWSTNGRTRPPTVAATTVTSRRRSSGARHRS